MSRIQVDLRNTEPTHRSQTVQTVLRRPLQRWRRRATLKASVLFRSLDALLSLIALGEHGFCLLTVRQSILAGQIEDALRPELSLFHLAERDERAAQGGVGSSGEDRRILPTQQDRLSLPEPGRVGE
jgi:hypothetical protein